MKTIETTETMTPDQPSRIAEMITRHVTVDRTRNAAQAIEAIGCETQYIDERWLAEMPLNGRDEDNVEFFELDHEPTPDELDREYEVRGLRPDPAATAKVIADDPAFADERPVVVQWRDKQNRACAMIFGYHKSNGRYVGVGGCPGKWIRRWRFAGVRK